MNVSVAPAELVTETERFAPYEVVPGPRDRGLLVLCDHASNALPPEYGTLGLPAGEFERHIGYDIGAEGVTRALAERLGAPAVLSRFSRLLIDPNRGEDDPTLVMRLSDGTIVPGNHPITPEEVRTRIARFHAPYHEAIRTQVEGMVATGVVPIVVSIHSFTPFWKGAARPWHIGMLSDADRRVNDRLIAILSRDRGVCVGDDEPYSGALRNDTMFTHATRRGLPQGLIELRQDLIVTPEGQAEWAERLAAALEEIDADPHMHERQWLGSLTGPVERIE